MAFSARRADGTSVIWIRRFSEPVSRVLPGSDGASQPFWSPDGGSIAYFLSRSVVVVGLDGGTPRAVCDLPAQTQPLGGSWSDGTIAFALAGRGLFRVPEQGGNAAPIPGTAAVGSRGAFTWPQLLPGGRHVIGFADGGIGGGNVWAVPVAGGAPSLLVRSSGAAVFVDGFLIFPKAGVDGLRQIVRSQFDAQTLRVAPTTQMVQPLVMATTDGGAGFSASRGVLAVQREPRVRHQLAWYERNGRNVEAVGNEDTIEDFDLAPDGQRLVASIRDATTGATDLWLIDKQRGERIRLTTAGGERALWSSNGRQIYFSRPGDGSAHQMTIETTVEAPFTLLGAASYFEDVTRDGKFFILCTRTEPSEIWLQRVDDPSEHRTLVKDTGAAASPRVSPNGRWLTFTLTEGGRRDVFVQPFDRPGERVRASNRGGFNPVWRDDNRELFFETADALMSVSVSDDRGQVVLGTPERTLDIHTQGVTRAGAHNVAVSGRAPRFLINTIVGDSDNAPIDVALNWRPADR